MTNQELIDYYADLLIIQYLSKPRAYATVQALVKPVIMDQLPLSVQAAFNVDTATGDQLAIIARYLGVYRTGYGFNGQVITLGDSDFRSLIKMAIARNKSGSSLYDIQQILFEFFPGQVFVFDNANMELSYFMSGAVGSQELAQMFVVQDLLPKPMGVALASLLYLLIIDNLFGFRTYRRAGHNNVGFNRYTNTITGKHWLSYKDTITI